VLQALLLALRWAVRREYLVVVRDLATPRNGHPNAFAIGDLHWAPLALEDAGRLREANPGLSSAEARRRLEEGQECTVGWRGSTIVHYRWDTSRPAYLPYLGAVFSAAVGDTFAVDAFTHPAYRRRGIDCLATVRALEDARARGFARTVTVVARWNLPGRRVALDKTSGRIVGTVTRWELGPLRRLRVTGAVQLTAGGFSLAR
jgi:GNAT superfamily N-acetyltransferase